MPKKTKKLEVDMASIYEGIAKEREIHRKRAKDSRGVLREILTQLGVQRVEATFDGCGDSGSFESSEFFKNKKTNKGVEEVQITLPDEQLKSSIEGIMINQGWSFADGHPKEITKEATLEEALEDLFYRILESEHGGWEINSGSYGTFSWTLDNDQIELTYNERIEEVNTSEETY